MTESIVEHNDAAQESFYTFQISSGGGLTIGPSTNALVQREIFIKCIKVQSCTSSWQQSKFLSEWELLVSDRSSSFEFFIELYR